MSETAVPSASRLDEARTTLRKFRQEHLLHFYDALSEAQRKNLLGQILDQDWAHLSRLVDRYVLSDGSTALPKMIEPAPCYPPRPIGALETRYRQARELGESLIREGRVAAFTVAGGQGTRLGWDAPKGTYPASPVRQAPLFQLFAEQILATGKKYGRAVPWYIMTSPLNDAPTRAFFTSKKFFGLSPQDVVFFPQGTLPSFSLDGRVLLEAPDRLASNPDGHGGSLKALHRSGALKQMRDRGVTQISYFQVDNTLVRCVDPLFLGLHAMEQAEMSTKVIPKLNAAEKMGVLCLADGHLAVIEYSDLPAELAEAKRTDGSLRLSAGNLAIHALSVDFVERLNQGDFALPPHRALKKVPHIDLATGRRVEPAAPNAIKLETFVFDALPLARGGVVLETVREEEFAPIKNADGADSPQTARRLQSDRAARWLEEAGLKLPRRADGSFDVTIDLSPLTALEPADLKHRPLPANIGRGAEITL